MWLTDLCQACPEHTQVCVFFFIPSRVEKYMFFSLSDLTEGGGFQGDKSPLWIREPDSNTNFQK